MAGLPIPDDRLALLVVLGEHVTAGLWCVATGALAASANKRTGRHPHCGRLYFVGLVVVLVASPPAHV